MNTLVVDASVFLSSFFDDDANSKISRKFFANLKENGVKISVPILTLFEVLHNFYRVSGDTSKTQQLQTFFVNLSTAKELKIFNLEASFLAYFLSLHEHFDLKTSDTLVVLTACREKVPLISWDKKMLKQGAKGVTTYTPEEYLSLMR